ncbi:MAG: YigZ family protein [Lachnospiraceae bacterium]|nr:YigZ family protein [Lachnospiraceae bacterium]
MESYRTIGKSGEGEIVEKKSRFIGEIHAVTSGEEALERLTAARKKYYDAKHHCSAYVLLGSGGRSDTEHASDDGEPSGTAGRPILEVLKGAGIKDAVLIVTRYFGGTLLGTGGLSRAYTASAKAALEAAEIREMRQMIPLTMDFPYAGEGAVRRYLSRLGLFPADSSYSDKVSFLVYAEAAEAEKNMQELSDLLSGQINISAGEAEYREAAG